MNSIQELFLFSEQFFLEYWFDFLSIGLSILALAVLFVFIRRAYLIKINDKFIEKAKWTMLEIKFPRENLKSPKAMEQVFASLHGVYSFGIDGRRKWIDGEVENWWSIEMVGKSDGIRFYIRTFSDFKNMVEAAFFSQYPEIEITEVPDYMENFPDDLPNSEYDIFATDYVTKQPDIFPIKTYPFFESPDEDKELDPMATLAEAASGLKSYETIILHLLFRATGEPDHPEYRKEIDKFITDKTGRPNKEGKKKSGLGSWVSNFEKALNPLEKEEIKWSEKKEEKPEFTFRMASPGEQDIMKAIENKASKSLFDVILRFIYVDRRDAFTKSNVYSVFSAVTQFSERNTNALSPADGTFTIPEKVPWKKGAKKLFFKKRRLNKRKKKMWRALVERDMPQKEYHKFGHLHLEPSIMGTEEMATIVHPPGSMLKSQRIESLTSKKSGPPMGLPVIDE